MHTKNNELSVGKKHEKSAKTSSTITRVMQRQKDERIEWNVGRVWTSTYKRKFFLSTDKLLRTIPGSSEGKTIRIGSGRVGSAEDSSLERPTRPSRPVLRAGGSGGSSIFSNLRFQVFGPLDQTTVISPTNWPDARGGLVHWYRFH
jgi:hypothetical protein